ncbi:MAG: type II secretion system GspH family protein [Candidatus Peribacteria bacterium]|jgi:prepilin-type N-terminal cleavage/methylation domain-containing protein|nr:type II secretion system GspH family protein [Candidatus Peribacteria bacterium]
MPKAFTLIETLIVIAVFGTGILAVLYGISQTLGNQDKAKTQITASFLAREGIELMYHVRDSNYRKKLPRNCAFQDYELSASQGIDIDKNPYCPTFFTSGMVLALEMDTEKYVKVETGSLSDSFEENFNRFQLFYATGENPPFRYGYT